MSKDIFRNLDAQSIEQFKKAFLEIECLYTNLQKKHIRETYYLFEVLKNFRFNEDWVSTESKPTLYRRYGANRDPLSLEGSLSIGGRCNIGGSQYHASLKTRYGRIVKLRGAIYGSDSETAARHEFGDYEAKKSKAITYQIKLKTRKQLRLVNFDQAVSEIGLIDPNAQRFLSKGSIGQKYDEIKTIIPTQLFGHWLMHHAGNRVDGLYFQSTVYPKGFNYCLYFDDTRHAKRVLKVR